MEVRDVLAIAPIRCLVFDRTLRTAFSSYFHVVVCTASAYSFCRDAVRAAVNGDNTMHVRNQKNDGTTSTVFAQCTSHLSSLEAIPYRQNSAPTSGRQNARFKNGRGKDVTASHDRDIHVLWM